MTGRGEPPTAVRDGDLSRAEDRASASPRDPSRRTLAPCVCGGFVRAAISAPTAGVRQHNRSHQHQVWRRATGKYDAIAVEAA